jgi:tRNA U34 5-methylaminomethyl-2-thiouridine-forming methyltransferase MnmC
MEKIILTADGSHTLFSERFKEHYHSTYGAITESRHIFINNGLKRISEENIHILEVGFGTGLNCLLTFLEIHKTFQKVRYESIEPFPVKKSILAELNYPTLLGNESINPYNSIISAILDQDVSLNDRFILRKISSKLENLDFKQTYHLVYFDAFSPEVQPEMWSEANFKKLYDALLPEGILVTYSCKGVVKRALKSAGFSISKLPGPPGKREMLLAKKI